MNRSVYSSQVHIHIKNFFLICC